MFGRIIERLESLGYKLDNEADGVLLREEMDAGRDYLLVSCNLSFLPKVLESAYIDLVCGSFLKAKLYVGGISEEEAGSIVESITEGDVSVKYASGKELSNREKLEALISGLMKKDVSIAANRRLKW